MASLPLPPSNPSEATFREKIPTMGNTNFNGIPSWVSLSRCSSLSKTHQNQIGLIENLHLVSLSKQGNLEEALKFLKEMDMADISVDNRSYESLFETCGRMRSLWSGRMIHERLRRKLKNPSLFLWNSLLRMYCNCGCLAEASNVFEEMPTKNLVSWSTMVSAYAQNEHFTKAFWLFAEMQVLGINPYAAVYVSLLRAFLVPSCLKLGKQIHSHVIRTGLTQDILLDTALSNMYVKCGCLESSKLIFDRMADKNAVTWTGLMVGYTQVEKHKEALAIFERMIEEGVRLDGFVFSIVLKACSELKDLEIGRQIHGYIVKFGMDSEVSAGAPLVDFYVKCGSLDDAHCAFEVICHPNDVAWSAMISGYSQNGKFEECLRIFKNVRSRDVVLNSFIYTSIFQACSAIADLNLGTQVHADAVKKGLISDLYGESALITMYSRSGCLEYACRAFDSIDEPDTVAWTALIAGCAYHGHASEALRLFERMQSCGIRPNAITFIGVFTACSHSGLVSVATQYLNSMRSEYGVDPTIDHYNCMVDIYSRAGRLEEAFELINTMPFEPDLVSWKSLLGGCWRHRNVELGNIAAKNLLQLNPEDTSGYILMFNLHASCGKWEEAASIRKLMVERDLRKEVSCSWITVKGKVHRFIVGDRHHPQTKKIYSKLEELKFSMMSNENTSPANYNAFHNLPEERKEQLLDHSERLAIAFGLISHSSNAPILVFKNLRACTDCHEFAKHVSRITGHEIVIRDSSRFHNFKCGECSCNDYW